jgi:hypothetical protein
VKYERCRYVKIIILPRLLSHRLSSNDFINYLQIEGGISLPVPWLLLAENARLTTLLRITWVDRLSQYSEDRGVPGGQEKG